VEAGEAAAIASAQRISKEAKRLGALLGIPDYLAQILIDLQDIKSLLAGLSPTQQTVMGILSTKTSGYTNHFWSSVPFTSTAPAYIDIPSVCDLLMFSPTVEARVQTESAPSTDTPPVAANQAIAVTMKAKRIYVQGVSASGVLYVWAWW
jgi:hypothetical protein